MVKLVKVDNKCFDDNDDDDDNIAVLELDDHGHGDDACDGSGKDEEYNDDIDNDGTDVRMNVCCTVALLTLIEGYFLSPAVGSG